ncbi:hypothetical protein AOQ84DRAFT_1732 [Glonium stellatum]|uniref:Secreted protein n=1 Tax=Glonium stellatum TaxID=574774 RepID=A0A8E2F4F4_9PEZI|nr:hypothetical protein AOQ84DRAFT_1732 [Glonium stellatum]
MESSLYHLFLSFTLHVPLCPAPVSAAIFCYYDITATTVSYGWHSVSADENQWRTGGWVWKFPPKRRRMEFMRDDTQESMPTRVRNLPVVDRYTFFELYWAPNPRHSKRR